MIALTVTPGAPNDAQLTEVDEPRPAEDELLVEMLAFGVCGTDREIVAGRYSWPPPGRDRLVLGHESLGGVVAARSEVVRAPSGRGPRGQAASHGLPPHAGSARD